MTKEYINRIIGVLEKNNVKFVITGGVAKLLRNEKKSTMDLDILVSIQEENLKALKQFVLDLNVSKYQIIDDLKKNRIIKIQVFPFSIDILPKLDGLNTEKVFENCEKFSFENKIIPLISKKDLITNYNHL
ncbi:hypothetical protein M4I21_13980 [Cellulophaga sp. 20_2_10]|uniref:nucleotidyltransferase domain-containing protein n=1 Tax=Cellulophaga sp. 20_2_10 TaxID=2942476 RepID=UPI00201AD678|nr:hypothetical protein [Cellulophaga sp. 20_2_10]MCL5246927.1 hypothetical protein [Cellulophaga sp. 20_2_10]